MNEDRSWWVPVGDVRQGTLRAWKLPTAVCTIYDGNVPDAQERCRLRAGLALFNDIITREAFSRGLPLIDLRLICTEPED